MLRKVIITTFLGVCTVAPVTASAEGDPAAGKTKAAKCAGCHGQEGISNNDMWPNLAGQKEGYLIKQIKAFRDGERTNPQMSPMVKGLSDQDIKDLAAYYSSLDP